MIIHAYLQTVLQKYFIFIRNIQNRQENPVYPEEQCISPASPLCSSSHKTRSDPFKFSFLFSCFIREDASKPPLSPLYRGPYLVLSKYPKYFLVEIGSKSDSVSVDRLKPVLSDHPVTPQQPPRRGRPLSSPAPLAPAPSAPAPLSSASPAPLQRTPGMKKKVRFSPQQLSPLPVRRNLRREVRDNHRVLHHLHHLNAGGTPVETLEYLLLPGSSVNQTKYIYSIF